MPINISSTNAVCNASLRTGLRLRPCAVVLLIAIGAIAAFGAAAWANAMGDGGEQRTHDAVTGNGRVVDGRSAVKRSIGPNESTSRRYMIAGLAAIPLLEMLAIAAFGGVLTRKSTASVEQGRHTSDFVGSGKPDAAAGDTLRANSLVPATDRTDSIDTRREAYEPTFVVVSGSGPAFCESFCAVD